jgi:hypothetical protein
MERKFDKLSFRIEKSDLVDNAAECWCLSVLTTVPIAIAEFQTKVHAHLSYDHWG